MARTPLMLISNGLESRPALLAGDDLVSFSSSLLWMDEASLPLLLLLLLGSEMAHGGITQPYPIRMLCHYTGEHFMKHLVSDFSLTNFLSTNQMQAFQ